MKTFKHMLKRHPALLFGAIALASGLAAVSIRAEEPKSDSKPLKKPAKVEAAPDAKKIEITGSRIPQKVRRVGAYATDTQQPLHIVDRAEIERSGAATLEQVLRRQSFVK